MDLDPVATLTRWTDAGAVWRLVSRRGQTLTVGLYRCDGGEEVDRIVSDATELNTYVGDRTSSED